MSPPSSLTRPTTDKVRGAIFNSLMSIDVLTGASVADLFAGTGACGIEALSRGAVSAVFVEKDFKAAAVIKANLAAVGFSKHAEVVVSDVFKFLERDHHFDLVIADPPYGFDKWHQLLEAINADVVVCEADRELHSTDKWTAIRNRKHGESQFTVFELAKASA